MDVSNAQTWIEPLNARESEILRLFAAGLSNREVASQLNLSLETIKWYNKQIFSKLGVNSRGKALATARDLHLLDSSESLAGRVAAASSHNLPSELTTFVGRLQESAQVRALLHSSRLVVLTGPGGAGKTRLALKVASELIGYYRDGIWLVELAPLHEPYLVANVIAQVLNLTIGSDASLVDTLKRHLAQRHMLLVLDNFEHLLDAAPLVGELLAAAPQLVVLATSRERLHVYGEQEYLVSPLALPDLPRRETPAQLLGYDAVNLFIQRAITTRPEIAENDTDIIAAAEICVRLDGLPLAIELAASQVKYFTPPVLARQLEEGIGALPGGPRDLPARQRTLRATIQWSYDLLQPEERLLFARLAVFRGGSSLQGIEAICGHDLPGKGIDALTALVDKNLVLGREDADGEPRFGMLETVRQFAEELLEASGEREALSRSHAEYFASLAEHAGREMRTPDQTYWYRRLRLEQDNLRAAMTWSLEGAEAEPGLRLVAAQRDYWYYSGFFVEGRRWAELALARSASTDPALEAGVLTCAGVMSFSLHDFTNSKTYQQRALEVYQQLGDERHAAWSMVFLGSSYLENPLEMKAGPQLIEQSLASFRKLGDNAGAAQALILLGEFARIDGEYEAAAAHYRESLAFAQQVGDSSRIAMNHLDLGFIAYHQERYRDSLQLIQEGIRAIREGMSDYGIGVFLACLAGPLAALGAAEQAARMLGFSFALLRSMNASHQRADQREINLFVEDARLRLGDKAFHEAWQSGESMTLAEALALALDDSLVAST